MAVEETILECVRALPPAEREKVREFAERLRREGSRSVRLESLEGLWRDFDFDLTDGDIAEARREMWGNFPRDFDS